MSASKIYITKEQMEALLNKEEAIATLSPLTIGSDKFEQEVEEISCDIETKLEEQLGRELNEQEYPLVWDFVDEFVAQHFPT